MWQWYYEGNWVPCTPENQAKLDQNESEPSLEPIVMHNPFGTISGRLEDNYMQFRMIGEQEDVRCFIRKGPKTNESPIYAIIERGLRRILPYDVGRKLFRNGVPLKTRKEMSAGTEHYIAENGRLYKIHDGVPTPLNWEKTLWSKYNYDKKTKTRYTWEFKGAFRWERIRAAVSQLSSEMEDSSELEEAFESFDPELDVTEHGPYQFCDYLISREQHELAIRVMDAYHANEPSEWICFDATTNAIIEMARAEGRPMAPIMVRGHQYVLVFDSGSGASGQPPIVIRPLRYERLLTSIEENVGRRQWRTLFEALEEVGCNPRMFMMAVMVNENAVERLIPPEARERIQNLLRNDSSGSLATALQNQLPPLLEKYKECDVRMSVNETLNQKPLEKPLKATLVTGLRVPDHLRQHCDTFQQLIEHIYKNQAWDLGKGKHTCDICSAKTVVLSGHCGSAKACLKCWTESLHLNHMSCPFCRQEVDDAQLTLVTSVPKSATRQRKKRKRRVEFSNAEDALKHIHQDKLYAHFKLDDNQPMRKWFTVLMRSGMLKNGQLPRNMQAKKTLRTALHEFNIL